MASQTARVGAGGGEAAALAVTYSSSAIDAAARAAPSTATGL
jgi:hypothetical protein